MSFSVPKDTTNYAVLLLQRRRRRCGRIPSGQRVRWQAHRDRDQHPSANTSPEEGSGGGEGWCGTRSKEAWVPSSHGGMLSAPGGSAEKTAKGEIYRVVFLPTVRRNAIVLSEGTCPLLVEAIAYLLLGTLLFIYFYSPTLCILCFVFGPFWE